MENTLCHVTCTAYIYIFTLQIPIGLYSIHYIVVEHIFSILHTHLHVTKKMCEIYPKILHNTMGNHVDFSSFRC